jgi:hypothetical protein
MKTAIRLTTGRYGSDAIRGIAQNVQGVSLPETCAGTETDKEGHFELTGIPDGNYRRLVKDSYGPSVRQTPSCECSAMREPGRR